jgi:hypothetical protein
LTSLPAEPQFRFMIGHLLTIAFECRDIGYGVESGVLEGIFTGECDTSGKWTFQPFNGAAVYLFSDEVIDAEVAP